MIRRELELPPVGFVNLQDPETGEMIEVDTRHPKVRALFAEDAASRRQQLSEGLKRSKVDELAVRTDQPYSASLHRFFRMRERRQR